MWVRLHWLTLRYSIDWILAISWISLRRLLVRLLVALRNYVWLLNWLLLVVSLCWNYYRFQTWLTLVLNGFIAFMVRGLLGEVVDDRREVD